MTLSLSIIVPAYNEDSSLTRTVLAAEAVLRSHITEHLEWILVDDGSVDGTWADILSLSHAIPNVIPLRHTANRGLGAAIWTGMEHASAEWCTWMPADGQMQPQAFVEMVQLADDSDIVLLIREETEQRPWGRRILTLGLHGLMRTVLGPVPYGYSGVFLVRREILQEMRLYSTTGLQNSAVALHCRRNGYRIRQIGTAVRPRMSGRSKVANLPTMLKTLRDVIRLRSRV